VFRQLYTGPADAPIAKLTEAKTVYTNTVTAGAMRAYGTPQAEFAVESQMDDMARQLGIDPIEFRFRNVMPVGWQDPFTKNVNYFDSFRQCVEKGRAAIGWDEKRRLYANQSGPVRRGVGMAIFWYNTAVWPISVEVSSCRLVLNQDGSVQLQVGETEIGQGADTVWTQMAAESLGIAPENVHVISTQDTDVTPFGTGAYGSRQTYVASASIAKASSILKEKILRHAAACTRMPAENLDIVDGQIVLATHDNQVLLSLGALATEVLYSPTQAEHLTAETTAQVKTNAFSFGCGFAEVEVDIPLCTVKLLRLINVHDAGRIINPKMAEGQVHGGMSMAIGYGLYETLFYDPKTGRPLNGNFLDYKLPTTLDQPPLEALFVENPEPTSAFGTKALGEPPAVPGAPAIRNAILNATGVAINRLPMTPHVLFEEFTKAGLL
jgi:xanthine dehydrogenase molybdenum-binding subunit